MAELELEQRRTLHVLAFLFYRMGLFERAGRVYAVLARPAADGSADARARIGRAACLLALGDPDGALRLINAACAGRVLSTAEAPLLLMKAQALHAQGRAEESAAARDAYMRLAGERSSS